MDDLKARLQDRLQVCPKLKSTYDAPDATHARYLLPKISVLYPLPRFMKGRERRALEVKGIRLFRVQITSAMGHLFHQHQNIKFCNASGQGCLSLPASQGHFCGSCRCSGKRGRQKSAESMPGKPASGGKSPSKRIKGIAGNLLGKGELLGPWSLCKTCGAVSVSSPGCIKIMRFKSDYNYNIQEDPQFLKPCCKFGSICIPALYIGSII